MKFNERHPPRAFTVGRPENSLTLYDCGSVTLEPDEQITLVTADGKEADVTRKAWGYYLTPSLNRRLRRFNLRVGLVKSYDGTFFVWMVEEGKEEKMLAYAAEHGISFLTWLDDAFLERLAASADRSVSCPCRANDLEPVFTYDAPPPGEVGFPSIAAGRYHREFLRCRVCGHFLGRHDLLSDGFYQEGYVNGTYGDDAGIAAAFHRIMALSPDSSDNAGRVARVVDFARLHLRSAKPRVLDVGAGLCVFLARLKEEGWIGTALDPDPRAVAHARDLVGIAAIQGSFADADGLGCFDVISFNKVLEHLVDPIAALAAAANHLEPGGFVYLEVPDGEAAAADGPGREEFFIEHWHAYSASSLALTAERAGFRLEELERLREPSTKFTLRAFLSLPKGVVHVRG
jgi:SAM-dependent methyltransferase